MEEVWGTNGEGQGRRTMRYRDGKEEGREIGREEGRQGGQGGRRGR